MDMLHFPSWLEDGGSDSDSDDDSSNGDVCVESTLDAHFEKWCGRYKASSGSGSDVENYEYHAAAKALWDAKDDDRVSDGWESGGSDFERFDGGAMNVEVPLHPESPLKERGRKRVRCNPYLMVYLVGEELGDGGPSSEASTVVVQGYAWHALPHETVEAVLLRLPAVAQARCRAVCKAWLSMLSSPEFCRRNFVESLTRMTPPLCAVDYYDGRDAPPSNHLQAPLYKSLKLDLSFLPEVFHTMDVEIHSCPPSGLLCLGCNVDEGMRLCVLNPVNQSFKVLPLLAKHFGMAFLSTEAATATDIIPSFKVYVSLDLLQTKKVAVYSSVTGEWKGFAGRSSRGDDDCPLEMPDEPDPDEARGLPMSCNGSIYTLVCTHRPRLVRLSTEGGARYPWNLILPYFDKHRGPEWVYECFLADHRGRLLCCCGGIWMLDDAMEEWIPIAERCPPEILPPCNPRKKHTLKLERVQVAGDLVVFFHQVEIRHGTSLTYKPCPVAFDMIGKHWRKVPEDISELGYLFQAMPNMRF